MSDSIVSTIIPVYNRPRQVLEAVASVLAQEYRPIEVIVVDDGSTDETGRMLQSLAAAHPDVVRTVTQSNAGPGAARETGRALARGDFIQYLDSDDVLLPEKFTVQVRALEADACADVAYGMTRFRNADGICAPGPWKESGVPRSTMFPSFLTGRWWDTPTPLYRREICDRAGSWSDARLEEDWEYDCRIASLGARLVWCNQYVCEVRDHSGDRLCRGSNLDAPRMRNRARSHLAILSHALRAGVPAASPEMQHFARALFLLARQCGAAGLAGESSQLFEAARRASEPQRARGLDFRAYRALAELAGWRCAGKASVWLDQWRGTGGP